MERKHRFSLGYFLVAFVILLLMENYLLSSQVQNLTYNEFKHLLKAGNIFVSSMTD